MKKFLLLVLLAALAAGILLYRHFTSNEITIRLSQQEIDSILARQFPRDKKHWKIVKITYSDPQAMLVPDTNKVRISIKAKVRAGIKPLEYDFETSATVLTKVSYDADQKKVILKDASCESFDLPVMPEQYRELTREALNLTSTTCFEKIPIYELKPRNQAQRVARMVLRDVHVDGDTLVFTLKLPDSYTE